jgi:dihydrodipicolinate synthase/N-acetylneuraminate lyase
MMSARTTVPAGVIVPLVTPFRRCDEDLDEGALRELVGKLIAMGSTA